MTTFNGIRVNEPIDGLQPVSEKSLAIVGAICTATAPVGQATTDLNAAFPLNTPVLITDLDGAIAKAGTGGTLKPVLQTLRDQGRMLTVIVRVGIATGEEEDPTQDDLVIGADGGYTGMQALLVAQAQTGQRPRILGAPGLDTEAVASALAGVAQKLGGYVYAHCRDEEGAICATRDDAVDYRENFGQREIMLIWPDFAGFDGKAVAVALGQRAMRDQRSGWHDSLANVAVNGVTGITHDVSFDIRSESTDTAVLNAAGITTLIRHNGFRFWGLRGCAGEDNAIFSFEVATRTAQAIQDVIAEAEMPYMGRPMTVGLARNVVEMANLKLATWTAKGFLMGGQCQLVDSANPQDQLMNGQLAVDYDYGYVAPLEGLTLNQRVTGRYYLGFADKVNV